MLVNTQKKIGRFISYGSPIYRVKILKNAGRLGYFWVKHDRSLLHHSEKF
jgi:hypothetical protein